MARWRRKVSVYIGGPDDTSSFICATFPRQTQPHPHNLLVFATPYRRWRGGVLLGQNVYDTSARRGTPQGILGAKGAPPSCTVAGAARSCSAVDARSGRHSRIRGRAPMDGWRAGADYPGRARTRADWTGVTYSGRNRPRTHTANFSTCSGRFPGRTPPPSRKRMR
ncbi:hypothetical protein K438DRAFT_486884 [Mycena galopus ATCC 62051]|nr:hypothetical protein K438DRAFT_486884 [Mycena galopus ATCC 62051]